MTFSYLLSTRIVELKLLSPKLPRNISIYNTIFTVTSSVKSPVQCNKCLHYGLHNRHCDENNHLIDSCPSHYATDYCCIFCKLLYIATDQNCQEWLRQRDIKNVMATANLLFKKALVFIKNKMYTSAFSYASVVNKHSLLAPVGVSPSIPEGDIQQPSQSNALYIRKSRKRSQSIYKKHLNLPAQNNFSLPNDSALNYGLSKLNNNKLPIPLEESFLDSSKDKNVHKDNSFTEQSWVPKLAN